MTQKLEPNRFQVQASYRNKVNVKLARALWPVISWGQYDRYSAHRWALKLIKADPKTGEDVVTALVNYDWMIETAVANYKANKPTCGKAAKCYDKAAEIFTAWKQANATN